MYVICIESSNKRGMGHLFRSFLYVDYLKKNKIDFIFLINNDLNSIAKLKEKQIEYQIVDFKDVSSNWEKDIIEQNNVSVWINDKFETSIEMGKHISETKALFCLIDDVGAGETFADMHFAGMIYPTRKKVGGKRTFCGKDYIILNEEIAKYRRKREKLEKIIVSLGGSDPYGVTLEVVEELKKYEYLVDVVIGPNFKFIEELKKINNGHFAVYQNVPSLIKTFSAYDMAITGGGVTCCEANAAGLPCIIIANAEHEENTGRFMEEYGGALYAGKHGEWNKRIFQELPQLNIENMSECGLNNFDLNAVERIMSGIKKVQEGVEEDEKKLL